MSESTPALAGLPTAAISDAMDRIGLAGTCSGIRPLATRFRMSGPAFTVRYRDAGSGGGTVGDFLDDVPPGGVVVIDNGSRLDCTVWGGIMTEVAMRRRLGGTVIDGVCRDVSRAFELSYPLYSRGSFMRTGKDRVTVEAIGEPVTIGEVEVRPGDVVCGDADGVVVVPGSAVEDVIAGAREVVEVEESILAEVAAGRSLVEARKHHGYHALQREEGR